MGIEQLRRDLTAVADDGVQAAQEAYLKNQFRFLGVKTPARRAVSTPWLRGEEFSRNLVERLWHQPEREFVYVACDGLWRWRRHLGAQDTNWLGGLVTAHSWWDSVDSLAKIVGEVATPEQMRAWAAADNLWLRRVAIIHQLAKKNNTDTDLLAFCIEQNLGSTEFFINKAIGWALRQHARRDPEWVRAFVAGHSLAPLSVREATKHL